MNILPSGCRYSDFSVFPVNWHTTRASINKTWRIAYRFYDPAFEDRYPHGYQKVVKSGLNRIKDLEGRQQLMRELINLEEDLLKNQGYNPILNNRIQPEENISEDNEGFVDPNTPFVKALEKGLEQKSMDPESKKDIKNKIPHVRLAADAIKISGKRLSDMPIQDIRRKHIRMLFNQIGKNKGEKWTANNFNRYRTDLRIIFQELNELEAMEMNPMDGIAKRKTTRNIRETLTPKERTEVDTHLKANYPTFWRFLHIFYHSGCRETEMLRIEYSHVFLKEQYFTVLVKKGEEYRWVKKAINEEALPLWIEIMEEARSILNEDNTGEKLFLFSEDLKPLYRKTPIRQEQISRRWKNHVKVQLGITADFYPLKHLRTTEDVNMEVKAAIELAQKNAAEKNGHTTTAMVRNIYDVNNKERILEIEKKANNKFA